MRIVSVVGARPNFMKIAPLEREFKKYDRLDHLIVHTGQHYDDVMSDVFFRQLGLSDPYLHLGIGSGGHGEMTGKIMIAFEQACLEIKPTLVIVVGDVDSTIAASLVARKLFIPVAHVEAGLRSFDETMPEEHNRRLTDHLSNLLFVSEPSGVENLQREGIDRARVHLVGDIMLETLQMFIENVKSLSPWKRFQLAAGSYALVTFHRPSNVDDPESLREIIDILKAIDLPGIFPMHPRTASRLDQFGLRTELESITNLKITSPSPYLDFLSLMTGARLVLSDSGSVQSEAAFFNIPCLVCRENTERPIYVEQGTSTLVGRSKDKVLNVLHQIETGRHKSAGSAVKSLGTGVAEKIVKTIADYLGVN